MGRTCFRFKTPQTDPWSLILIDTSTVVAWLDQSHPHPKTSAQAIVNALMDDDVAVSVVTLAELAVGGRTREAMEADLKGVIVIEVTADDAWRARQVFAR